VPRQALFAGLVVDEFDRPAETAYVGDDPCYVVDDAGFRRHILAEQVDRAVLEMMRAQISGNENELTEQAAKMLGQDDIFSKAMLQNQLKNIAQQFEALMQVGIPEDARAYLGMSGFKIIINVHGEVVRFNQPTAIDDGGEGGDE
jgi:peptidyl-tRNA hydrolase